MTVREFIEYLKTRNQDATVLVFIHGEFEEFKPGDDKEDEGFLDDGCWEVSYGDPRFKRKELRPVLLL